MYLVGLTGGIGSGKSVVAGYFEELGVPVIDADKIAHQIVEPSGRAYEAVLRVIGQELLLENGKIDRAALRKKAFDNPDILKQLEEILHPKIREELQSKIQKCVYPYCVVVIPLLIEKGSFLNISRILVTDCERDTQIERTVARDACSIETVERILTKQTSRENRLEKANDVISTEGDLEQVEAAVEHLHQQYLAAAGA